MPCDAISWPASAISRTISGCLRSTPAEHEEDSLNAREDRSSGARSEALAEFRSLARPVPALKHSGASGFLETFRTNVRRRTEESFLLHTVVVCHRHTIDRDDILADRRAFAVPAAK